MTYTYMYPRPMVSVDVIVNRSYQGKNEILLIKRLNDPFKDTWALPGGFVDEHEGLLNAAKRELKEETNIDGINLEQFFSYGDPGRDPRGHSISIVYYSFVSGDLIRPIAGDDAKEAAWFNLEDLPELAFDHDKIINDFKENVIKKKRSAHG